MKSDILHISSTPRSGSTLLGMLLGTHPTATLIGELYRMPLLLRDKRPCACGQLFDNCLFWTSIDTELKRLSVGTREISLFSLPLLDTRMMKDGVTEGRVGLRNPYRSILKDVLLVFGSRSAWTCLAAVSGELRRAQAIVQNLRLVHEAIRSRRGVPVIVDSSKNPGNMKALYLAYDGRMRIIYLLRDGRAVCHSMMREAGLPMAECAQGWKMEHRRQWLGMLSIPSRLVFKVRYEDLCADPVAELKRICAWSGLDYDPVMLKFRKNKHNVGGDSVVWKRREDDIVCSEKWRQQLSSADLNAFENIAGDLNRRLGYEY